MLDIEAFSEYCWCGSNPRLWNKRTGMGIKYRGMKHIVDTQAPYYAQVREEHTGRGFTFGT